MRFRFSQDNSVQMQRLRRHLAGNYALKANLGGLGVEAEVAVRIAVLRETRSGERRVAMTPMVIERLVRLGAEVAVQSGAGEGAGFADAAFGNVAMVADAREFVGNADVVLAVQPPAPETVQAMKPGATLVSFVFAEKEPKLVKALRA
jgi:H+-translocating NAD(P) transhydrogenase subunit alpha